MADKDSFKHVENSGVSQRDLDRGFTDALVTDEEQGRRVYPGGYVGEDPEEMPAEGFLGRAKGWER